MRKPIHLPKDSRYLDWPNSDQMSEPLLNITYFGEETRNQFQPFIYMVKERLTQIKETSPSRKLFYPHFDYQIEVSQGRVTRMEKDRFITMSIIGSDKSPFLAFNISKIQRDGIGTIEYVEIGDEFLFPVDDYRLGTCKVVGDKQVEQDQVIEAIVGMQYLLEDYYLELGLINGTRVEIG